MLISFAYLEEDGLLLWISLGAALGSLAINYVSDRLGDDKSDRPVGATVGGDLEPVASQPSAGRHQKSEKAKTAGCR
jgi:hypothetical protein